ncbi:hypothetical protein CU100_22595 [Phyllobacterium endophyticum]|uniref:Uncharacterized protein n=1 Tax=Phyllobacterium endophyticum TaxID=1149773 RepID=A0A2P7AML4_9HYPH|nr:hypothetical protein CU100_22595 [Phyllobacterium endophyticum]
MSFFLLRGFRRLVAIILQLGILFGIRPEICGRGLKLAREMLCLLMVLAGEESFGGKGFGSLSVEGLK